MTWPSRVQLRHADFAAITMARRKHFAELFRRLGSIPGVTPLHDHPPDGGPWVFPVIFEGRYDAHKYIQKLGVPAVAWDGVRPAQLGTGFPESDFLYHHLVFLPVHQGLDSTHLDLIEEAVCNVSNSRARSPV